LTNFLQSARKMDASLAWFSTRLTPWHRRTYPATSPAGE
jgi:hypothetical protein